MQRGETNKPCEGCGETGVRQAGEVCWRCRQLLKEARAARTASENQTECVVYQVPSRWPWYSCGATHRRRGTVDNVQERLRTLMSRLAHAVGVPPLGGRIFPNETPLLVHWPQGHRVDYSYPYCHLLYKPEDAATLDDLDTTIQEGLRAAYQAGVADGAHLLGQLAAGEMTVADFNQKSGVGNG